jgi:hypothetical protein
MAMKRFPAHPESASGDFFVENHECVACGAPHAVAPDLIGWAADGDYDHCIWKKQPETPEEWEQAYAAFDASCVSAYRYGGTDPTVVTRIGPALCGVPEVVVPGPRRVNVPVPFALRLTASEESRWWVGLKRVWRALRGSM